MTRAEWPVKMRELAEARISLSEKKNANYSGNDDNAFQNFDLVEILTNGRITREQGIYVRMVDKVARLGTLVMGDPDQVGESVQETSQDLACYSDILTACYDEKDDKPVMPEADESAIAKLRALLTSAIAAGKVNDNG